MIADQPKLVDYTSIESPRIHIMSLKVASRAAVDEYLGMMNEIYRDVTEHDEMRFLIDYRKSGMPSVPYVFRKGASWANSLQVHPPAWMAIVHQDEYIVGMMSTLIQTLRFGHLRMRFFKGDAGYDQAMAWLREDAV